MSIFCASPATHAGYELNLLARVLLSHCGEIINERLLSTTYQWIVLDIFSTDAQFDRLSRITLISSAVEGNGVLLILFYVVQQIGTA